MAPKSYVIAPFGSGQTTDQEPFLIPEDAFEKLEDAYVWRGRVKKRWGYSLFPNGENASRLRIQVDTTDGAGSSSGTVPGATFKVGQRFSIGTEIFTVNATGTPANLLTTGSATTATFDTTSGAYVFAGATAATAVYWYPAEPVMGILVREVNGSHTEDVIAFDTQFAYYRVGGFWERLGTALWTSSNSQFFWSTNYRGGNPYDTNFYVVNGKPLNGATDGIKYIPSGSTTWTSLRPQLDTGAGTRFLDGARIIVGFKDRLVTLYTYETQGGAQIFPQRCRFSQNGDPVTAGSSWIDDTPGVGGYIDAPTKEEIVTAELLKDRLIVYFERSTWELVYTGNTILPFRWQQINSELGAESRFSIIGFDAAAVGVGNRGIHACDGSNVRRIDEKIPDEVLSIHNGNDGVERVYGIRDYEPELVYWAFPSAAANGTYPDRVLVYNYVNQTWAFFNDSFTCFGYAQREADLTWADLTAIYGTWDNWNDPWDTGSYQSAFPLILGGNQEGWTVILDTNKSANSPSLQITDMTAPQTLTVIDHNLKSGDYVLVNGCNGITSLNGTVVMVESVTDANTIVIDPGNTFSGTYTGGGSLERVSGLNILSKQYNPGTPIGQTFSFPYADFLLQRTDEGQVSLDYYLDSNSDDSVQELASPGSLLGSNILFTKPEETRPEQANQTNIWHRYFFSGDFAFAQLRIFLSDSQLRSYAVATSDFVLNAIVLYVEPGGRITG